MRYGFAVTTGDPATAAELAREAESAGWDGVFTFDAIAIGSQELFDPWVVLAAMAVRTERVRLGAIVTPPSRRRPWKLARETMSVDRLSNGRLVLAVGLGALDDAGFAAVGEPAGARIRAELLDESLAILDGLWSGAPFGFSGRHYRFPPLTFRPRTVQQPRIPVWVVGAWPSHRSIDRAVRWDGILPQPLSAGGAAAELTPGILREVLSYVRAVRPTGRGAFDVVVQGTSPADPALAADLVRPWIDAGATWWIEAAWQDATVASLRARLRAGPPRA
jgi:alkanesulfonate monooxygenase SsuD/methylene tetrahydromethanopterin reductase-like flavin-dependent oxidoreductase (luciferase family)